MNITELTRNALLAFAQVKEWEFPLNSMPDEEVIMDAIGETALQFLTDDDHENLLPMVKEMIAFYLGY